MAGDTDRVGKDTPDGEEPERREGIDRLTGIWNKSTVESRIAEAMPKGGALFVCDLNHFKQINDKYGHLTGDEAICQTVQILRYMTRDGDILGRIGGDEFVIFTRNCRTEESAQSVSRRITERFAVRRNGAEKGTPQLTVTIGFAVCQKDETYQTLFQRAEKDMLGKRKNLRMPERKTASGDNYQKDVRQVREELMEQIRKPGAYCRDYETFKSIYRFLERSIIRSGQDACVILLSVVDEAGKSLLPDEKDRMMERLGENIRTTLRIGDVYTRYTSSQYLLLVIDTVEKYADGIADRIQAKFLESGGNGLLVHYCYKLEPARMETTEKG